MSLGLLKLFSSFPFFRKDFHLPWWTKEKSSFLLEETVLIQGSGQVQFLLTLGGEVKLGIKASCHVTYLSGLAKCLNELFSILILCWQTLPQNILEHVWARYAKNVRSLRHRLYKTEERCQVLSSTTFGSCFKTKQPLKVLAPCLLNYSKIVGYWKFILLFWLRSERIRFILECDFSQKQNYYREIFFYRVRSLRRSFGRVLYMIRTSQWLQWKWLQTNHFKFGPHL